MTPAAAIVSAMLSTFCGASATKYTPHVIRAAEKYNLDPRLLVSVMKQESGCDPTATGALGELGQMQLKKFTWATKGYNRLSDEQLRKPSINIRLGARHIHNCLLKCGGSLAGALGLYKGHRRRKDHTCREDTSYAREILARIEGLKVSSLNDGGGQRAGLYTQLPRPVATSAKAGVLSQHIESVDVAAGVEL